MNLTTQPSGGRGCGSRTEGSGYACCGTGEGGLPWHCFMLDPAVPYTGDQFRGIQYAEDVMPELIPPNWPESDVMLVDWVGKGPYPTVPHVMEEIRRFGMSRNIGGFDHARLERRTPYLVLVHARGAISWEGTHSWDATVRHVRMRHCKYQVVDVDELPPRVPLAHYLKCVYHLWPMTMGFGGVTDTGLVIEAPWGTFFPLGVVEGGDQMDPIAVAANLYPTPAFSPAAFAMLPITHIEFIGYVPEDSRVAEGGLPVYVVEE